ncbi:MAG: hypothetical protein ACYC27_04865 [Armatimonadota bacterium]
MDTAKFERKRNIKRSDISSIAESISDWNTYWVFFHDQIASKEEGPYTGVWLDLRHLLDDDPESFRLALMFDKENWEPGPTLHFLQYVSNLYPIEYGSVHVGTYIRVSDMVTLVHGMINDWPMYGPNPTYELGKEIHFFEKRIDQFGERVPRAEWANILSPAHVAALGGEEQIRKDCPCYLVERWGENLYIQLTESPLTVSKTELLCLNEYFQPVRFPDAPEAKYWQE